MIATFAFIAVGAFCVWVAWAIVAYERENRAWHRKHDPHGPGVEDSAGNVYCGCGEFIGNSKPSRLEDEIR